MSCSYTRKLSTAYSLLLSVVAASVRDLIGFECLQRCGVPVEKRNNKDCDTLASIRLRISHPDRVVFKHRPQQRLTGNDIYDNIKLLPRGCVIVEVNRFIYVHTVMPS